MWMNELRRRWGEGRKRGKGERKVGKEGVTYCVQFQTTCYSSPVGQRGFPSRHAWGQVPSSLKPLLSPPENEGLGNVVVWAHAQLCRSSLWESVHTTSRSLSLAFLSHLLPLKDYVPLPPEQTPEQSRRTGWGGWAQVKRWETRGAHLRGRAAGYWGRTDPGCGLDWQSVLTGTQRHPPTCGPSPGFWFPTWDSSLPPEWCRKCPRAYTRPGRLPILALCGPSQRVWECATRGQDLARTGSGLPLNESYLILASKNNDGTWILRLTWEWHRTSDTFTEAEPSQHVSPAKSWFSNILTV